MAAWYGLLAVSPLLTPPPPPDDLTVTLDKKLTFQRNKSLRLEQPAVGGSAGGGGPLHVLSTARGLTGSAPKLEEDIEKIKRKKEEKEEKRGGEGAHVRGGAAGR